MAAIIQPEALRGKYVNLREIKLDDAQFVIDLRTSHRARFLNPTKYDVEAQRQYIETYLKKDDEWYFIIEDKNGKPLGTIRIYNVKGKQFEAGSWLTLSESDMAQSLESEYLLKNYAYHVLGLECNCFEVRHNNKSVIKFHKLWGARIVREDGLCCYFELTKDEFDKNKSKILRIIYG